MESRDDCLISERILRHITPSQLFDIIGNSYQLSCEAKENEKLLLEEFGHNIFILAYQLSMNNQTIANIIRKKSVNNVWKSAITFYLNSTSHIEVVRNDLSLERIIFPIPPICKYIDKNCKYEIINKTKLDEHNSLVINTFFKL